ncbi:MAG: DUF61 family protein [Candidatus Methanomethylophilaceae archaeon]|jgi:uncharacterized protein (UPF0216 family)|nr:DUF61 family protein [Candidatus Methanomethylophilaceae archaeon]
MDFVKAIMSDLNRNLASSKPSLMEMEQSGDYTYRLRDGTVIDVGEEQFRRLWDICDDSQRLRLRIPIYVSTDTSGEVSAWKVEGSAEAAVVAKLLGKPTFRDDRVRLYNPDLKDLKKLIPDAYMVVFTP